METLLTLQQIIKKATFRLTVVAWSARLRDGYSVIGYGYVATGEGVPIATAVTSVGWHRFAAVFYFLLYSAYSR